MTSAYRFQSAVPICVPHGQMLRSMLYRKQTYARHVLNFTETIDVTAAYDMYVQNSKAGIMKRSGMDVDLTSDNSTLPLYSVRSAPRNLKTLLNLISPIFPYKQVV